MDTSLILLGTFAFCLIILTFCLLLILIVRTRTILFYGGAPYVASAKSSIQQALSLAEITTNDHFADLGCGDGQVVRAVAVLGAKAVGFEIDPLLFYEAKKKCAGFKNAEISSKNFWETDLSVFDVIYLFQIPYAMPRLAEKLKSDCRSGTRIISNSFKFPDWPVTKSAGSMFLYVL